MVCAVSSPSPGSSGFFPGAFRCCRRWNWLLIAIYGMRVKEKEDDVIEEVDYCLPLLKFLNLRELYLETVRA